ncbi:MAG: amidohydrolase family protein [Verrucomicrobia bacterium]|nr:amidohydrolase family protein [Verrucomicrobiota bacterium]
MRDGFRIFDAHTHIGTARHSGRSLTGDELLGHMDRFGVDRALVIPFPVVEDFRQAHELIARAVRAHPDRLAGAACLYPFISEAEFREEIRRCAEEFGFRALKLQPKFQPLNPVSSRSDFFFEAAAQNHLVVVAHTGDGVPFSLPSLFIAPARKFPEIRLVLAHSGGSVFFQEAMVAASVCPNIYVELSTLMPHHVAEVAAQVPSSRLMIGSDLPESLETEMSKILNGELPAGAKHDILWNTANSVFGNAH